MAVSERNQKKFKRFIEDVSFYYLLAVGFVSVRYNVGKREVYTSRFYQYYAYFVNALYLVSMPVAVHISTMFLMSFGTNRLLQTTDIVSSFLAAVVIALMIVTRRRRERGFTEIMLHLYTLDAQYFDRLPMHEDIARRYTRIYITKFVSTFSLWMVSIFLTLVLPSTIDLESILMALYYSNTGYLMHGLMFYYFSSMLYACQYFDILNREVRRLWHDLRQLTTCGNDIVVRGSYPWRQLMQLAAAELQQIMQVHWQITCSMQKMTSTYEYLIKAVLFSYVLQTITFGYYCALVYDGSLNIGMSFVSKIMGILSYVAVFLDLFLFYGMCEHTTRVFNEMSWLLSRFQLLPLRSAHFEQQCEAFTLQLVQRPFSIELVGMYKLNTASFLALWGFILQQTLFLIQHDYSSRKVANYVDI